MRHSFMLFIGQPMDATEKALGALTLPGFTLLPSLGWWTPGANPLPGTPRVRDLGCVAIVGDSPLTAAFVAGKVAQALGEDSVAYMDLPPLKFS